MIDQLLLSKRFFQEGESFCEIDETISTGIAISFFQDAIELILWLIIKEFSIDVKETEAFTSMLDKVEKHLDTQGKKLPHRAKIIELNKARVNFKHYGNLPASSEAAKFRGYTESYLRTAFDICFQKDFDDISMAELIRLDSVRQFVKESQKHLTNQDYQKCVDEIAKAKLQLFSSIKIYLPEVDHNLKNSDIAFETQFRSQGAHVFNYIYEYMNMLRKVALVNACGVSMKDFARFEARLPYVSRYGDGSYSITRTNVDQSISSPEEAKFLLQFMIDLALKVQELV